MVSKTSAADTAKKSTTPAAKNSVSKSTVKKVSTVAKTSKAKPATKPVAAKVNVAPVEKVLEIKAQNEDKKVAKAVAKAIKNTTVVSEETKCCCCSGKCQNGICASWVRAYKNMFNFKGRTSRYEFWGFILLNIIFAFIITGALLALMSAAYLNSVLTYISVGAMLAFIIIEAITYLSLIVRRLHDSGHTAWKGFFRPTVLSVLLCGCILVSAPFVIHQLGDNLFAITPAQQIYVITYLLLLILASVFMIYYSMKTIVISSFFDEDDDNVYGKACYNDKCCVAKAFKYAIIYFTIVMIAQPIVEQIVSYINYAQD